METTQKNNDKRIVKLLDAYMPQSPFIKYLTEKYPKHVAPKKANLSGLIKKETIRTITTSYGSTLIDVCHYERTNNLISPDIQVHVAYSGEEVLPQIINFLSNVKKQEEELISKLSSIKNELSTLTEQSSQKDDFIKELKEQKNELEINVGDLGFKTDDLEKEINNANEALRLLQIENKKIDAKNTELKEAIDKKLLQIEKLNGELVEKKKYIEKLTSEHDNYKQKAQEQNIEIKELQSLAKIQTQRIEILEKSESKFSEKIKDLKVEFKDKTNELKNEHRDKLNEVNQKNMLNIQDIQNKKLLEAFQDINNKKV